MGHDKDSFFADVKTERAETSGGPCDLPILYRDASLFTAVWRVDPERARERLGDAPFEPWLAFGKAVVMLCAFDYRDTTIGPYGELGIGILVKWPGTQPSWSKAMKDWRAETSSGLYVTNLPVTSDRARAAGIELWGYPKYTTGIETTFAPREVTTRLAGELELSWRCPKGGGLPLPPFPLVTFSVTGRGRILRTSVSVDSRPRFAGGRTLSARVLGKGPSADTFTQLGLDRTPATIALRADQMRTILPRGIDMGAAPRREREATSRAPQAAEVTA